MKNLILHIGRHKTGTSSIQYFLANSPEVLNNFNYYYPQTGRNGKIAHHEMSVLFNPKISPGQKELNQFLNELSEEVNNTEENNIIISSEAFQNISNFKYLKKLYTIFNHISCIIYLREPLDYLQSSYRQKIHNTNYNGSFAEYSREINFDYQKFCKKWSTFCNNITLLFFHRGFIINDNIVDDFNEKLNIEHRQISNQHFQNPSIGGNLLFYKKLINSFELHKPIIYNIFSSLAKEYKEFRSKFHISSELSEIIRQKHRDNIEYLNNKFGFFDLIDFSQYKEFPDMTSLKNDIIKISENDRIQSLKHKFPLLEFVSNSNHNKNQ